MENKKRLIDANALAKDVYALRLYVTGMRNGKTLLNECMEKYRNEVLRTICKAPTVDSVEVVHARWSPIRNFGGGECYGYCTNCKTPVKADNATGLVMNNRFCHWCGAKMDGGNEDV